ncbi:MAG: hypothetical protein JWM91_4484 [Rhodospirillales bacterium]|nr:hypothetical protein [Rhodospirillales bacterium]
MWSSAATVFRVLFESNQRSSCSEADNKAVRPAIKNQSRIIRMYHGHVTALCCGGAHSPSDPQWQ